MGYPTVFAEGQLTSWGSANFYSTLLAAMIPNRARVSVLSDAHNITAFGATAQTTLPGLRSHRLNVSAELYAAGKLGNAGLVTFSVGGYTSHVRAWSLRISAGVHDITEFVSGSPPQERRFRPNYSNWGGTLIAVADSATALVNTTTIATTGASPSLATLTLKMTSTETFSGTVMLQALDVDVTRGGENIITYGFVGSDALTPAGGSNPFGTTAFGIPIWSQSGYLAGTYAGAYVLTTSSGKTVTGQDSFWTEIAVNAAVGAPVSCNISAQGSGTLTPA